MPWRNGYCQGWREAGSIRVGDPSGVAIAEGAMGACDGGENRR
ncbi:hypothetical protein [Edwardsiella tarda]